MSYAKELSILLELRAAIQDTTLKLLPHPSGYKRHVTAISTLDGVTTIDTKETNPSAQRNVFVLDKLHTCSHVIATPPLFLAGASGEIQTILVI